MIFCIILKIDIWFLKHCNIFMWIALKITFTPLAWRKEDVTSSCGQLSKLFFHRSRGDGTRERYNQRPGVGGEPSLRSWWDNLIQRWGDLEEG